MARLVANKYVGVVLCLFLFLGVSSAEDLKGAFSISPHVGGFHFDDNLDIDDGVVFGIGAGYNFTQNLSLEFVLDLSDMSTESGLDLNGYSYRFEGIYQLFPEGKVIPFFALGVGAMTFDPSYGDLETKLISDYGAGVKYFFRDGVALRGDVRHVFVEDQSHINILYTLGVEFLLNKKAAAPPPPPPPPPDSDGDGVIDSEDKCPDTPRGVRVDRSGCPLDSDGDGVPDYQDKCPDTPRGVKVDRSGCPLDSDGDGVYDYLDKCPDTPRDLKVDSTGCPILMKENVSIRLDIQFDVNKADIKPEYHERLKEVADFMVKYPETKAVIEGHTDSTGAAAYNQKLSQRRAESVRDYLIKNFNISPDRLTAKGYGEEKPVASNDTKEGRSQNRRIEAVFNAEKEYYEKK